MNIEEIKNNLIKEKVQIEELIKNLEEEKEEILKEPVSASDEEADRYEYKEEVYLFKQMLEEKIKKIEKALLKIQEGKYGFCENCGKQIEQERLTKEPSAEVCRSCLIK